MGVKVAIIGAGNLATRLSLALQKSGANLVQVYSRSISSASTLAKMLNCAFTSNLSSIEQESDIYLIAVSDSAIEQILPNIKFNNKLIAHTAGSVNINVLKRFSVNYGVFYPLQTFSKNRDVSFDNIPICIEASSAENESKLMELGKMLSSDIRIVNSEQRKQLHLAAVFACNFVNHLYSLSEEIVREKGLPFDILLPLIKETADKVEQLSPFSAQTGPAKRADKQVIDEQLAMLGNNELMKTIYQNISNSIASFHNKQNQFDGIF